MLLFLFFSHLACLPSAVSAASAHHAMIFAAVARQACSVERVWVIPEVRSSARSQMGGLLTVDWGLQPLKGVCTKCEQASGCHFWKQGRTWSKSERILEQSPAI